MTVDDPGMAKKHVVWVIAPDKYTARFRAARTAILLDRRGCGVQFPSGEVPFLWRVNQARTFDLVNAVAQYATP